MDGKVQVPPFKPLDPDAMKFADFPIEKLSLKDDVDAGQELFSHCHLHE
jgi:hypothetical protein